MPVSRSISSLSLIRLRLLRPVPVRRWHAGARVLSCFRRDILSTDASVARMGQDQYTPPLLRLAVHFQIHLLIEEAQMTFYVGGCRYRVRIVPDECFPSLTAHLHRVVGRHPLVGTFRFLVARA